MRASLVAVSLAIAGYASAQGAGSLPTCAQECLKPFADSSGIAGCPAVDIGCICASGGFLNSIGCCLIAECDEADQQAAISFAANICSSAGVTVPSEIECADSSSASSSASSDSAALSSTISSAISSASSAISSFVSSRSESSESVESILSSVSSAISATGDASTTATNTQGRATSAVSSAVSAASSAATSAAGAAGYVAVGGSGIVGGLVAALALL